MEMLIEYFDGFVRRLSGESPTYERKPIAHCRICNRPIFYGDETVEVADGKCHDLCYYEEVGHFIQKQPTISGDASDLRIWNE